MTAAGVLAAPSGEQLLARSEQAEHSHSYRGVRIIRMSFRDRTMEAVVRVLHRKPDTTRTEYLSPPSMTGTAILQIGAQRWRRSPHDGQWEQTAPAPETGGTNLLRRNYDLRVTPASPVANRPCLLLLITPTHEGNPSKRIWVDEATGLALRTELLNWKQENISSSTFREIEIDPDLSAEADLLRAPARALSPVAPASVPFQPIRPRYLPPGYVFSGSDVITLGQHLGLHLRYSDGLNSISLFQAPAPAFGGKQPLATEEWHFTHVMSWRRGDMAYAALGDIDPGELRKIADSMGPAAPGRGR